MKFYSSTDIDNLVDFPTLIEELRTGFTKKYTVPPRMHLDYENPVDKNQNTLLLMPAVQCSKFGGVKLVNVSLENSLRNLASIQGIYYLMNAITGEPVATFDAKSLTNWRTAAASALASDYLSRKDSSSLLMIGTGSLAPYLIDAHAAIRPIKQLFIYGRTKSKAESLAELKSGQFEEVTVVENLDTGIPKADIISAATFTTDPLINGSFLIEGQHVDLVGAFKPTSRESDDEAIRRSKVYIDSEMATKEAGEIVIPLSNQVISPSDIQGDLFKLCRNEVSGRESENEITLFKSVGHALEDLVAAELIHKNQNQ